MRRKNYLLAMACVCALALSVSGMAVMAEDETEAETEFDESELVAAEISTTDETEDETADADGDETADAEGISDDDAEEAADDETEEDTEAETEAERPTYVALDYVVLGEYKGITVQMEELGEVTDEDVLEEVNYWLTYSDLVDTLTEGTVQDGDIANIVYVGKIDGEEFDGGSGEYDLEIGSGTFIEGFEEGLIGAEIGETVDLELTFPEDYDEEVAGQDVVFTVTVNSVQRAMELSDDVVNTLTDGEYTDVDSFLTYVRSYLEESAQSTWDDEVLSAIYEQLAATSEITEYPQELLDYCLDEWMDFYEYYATAVYQMELEEMLDYFGYTLEEFTAEQETVVQLSVQQELLLMAVAETEGMEISEEEYQEGLERYAEYNGLESADEVEAYYTESELNRYFLIDKVYDFLQENAVIEILYETEMETETE
ncbi:MAG: FKBP-type peptidyl-prolyl cis-trans isomerase [Lachnospiraceae bacterium]|nr:FKBP-type peptidyl-prolyl cis-trans isomerase [Lachnospiraceae bacterium]